MTLYGIIDQSIRYTNHVDDGGGSKLQLANGAITNSRFGLKGEEDLGDGSRAVFRLENGFDPRPAWPTRTAGCSDATPTWACPTTAGAR